VLARGGEDGAQHGRADGGGDGQFHLTPIGRAARGINPRLDIAERVNSKIGAEIVVSASNDPRSYRQDSRKLLATGFHPSHSVADAIGEIAEAFQQNALPDGDSCYTVKWMQGLKL
jgi:hypothetical protein